MNWDLYLTKEEQIEADQWFEEYNTSVDKKEDKPKFQYNIEEIRDSFSDSDLMLLEKLSISNPLSDLLDNKLIDVIAGIIESTIDNNIKQKLSKDLCLFIIAKLKFEFNPYEKNNIDLKRFILLYRNYQTNLNENLINDDYSKLLRYVLHFDVQGFINRLRTIINIKKLNVNLVEMDRKCLSNLESYISTIESLLSNSFFNIDFDKNNYDYKLANTVLINLAEDTLMKLTSSDLKDLFEIIATVIGITIGNTTLNDFSLLLKNHQIKENGFLFLHSLNSDFDKQSLQSHHLHNDSSMLYKIFNSNTVEELFSINHLAFWIKFIFSIITNPNPDDEDSIMNNNIIKLINRVGDISYRGSYETFSSYISLIPNDKVIIKLYEKYFNLLLIKQLKIIKENDDKSSVFDEVFKILWKELKCIKNIYSTVIKINTDDFLNLLDLFMEYYLIEGCENNLSSTMILLGLFEAIQTKQMLEVKKITAFIGKRFYLPMILNGKNNSLQINDFFKNDLNVSFFNNVAIACLSDIFEWEEENEYKDLYSVYLCKNLWFFNLQDKTIEEIERCLNLSLPHSCLPAFMLPAFIRYILSLFKENKITLNHNQISSLLSKLFDIYDNEALFNVSINDFDLIRKIGLKEQLSYTSYFNFCSEECLKISKHFNHFVG